MVLKSGGIQAAKFYENYNGNEGFIVKVIDTTKVKSPGEPRAWVTMRRARTPPWKIITS